MGLLVQGTVQEIRACPVVSPGNSLCRCSIPCQRYQMTASLADALQFLWCDCWQSVGQGSSLGSRKRMAHLECKKCPGDVVRSFSTASSSNLQCVCIHTESMMQEHQTAEPVHALTWGYGNVTDPTLTNASTAHRQTVGSHQKSGIETNSISGYSQTFQLPWNHHISHSRPLTVFSMTENCGEPMKPMTILWHAFDNSNQCQSDCVDPELQQQSLWDQLTIQVLHENLWQNLKNSQILVTISVDTTKKIIYSSCLQKTIFLIASNSCSTIFCNFHNSTLFIDCF